MPNRNSVTATLVLAAGAVQRIPGQGTAFYITDSDNLGFLEIQTDTTSFEKYQIGTGKKFEDTFDSITVKNPTVDVVTVTIWVGFGDYVDRRTNILLNRLASILPIIEPNTEALEAATTPTANQLDAGDTLALPGTPGAGQLRRKAILVTNLDANLNLEILDGNGDKILTVFPRTNITLPISEACSVHNANGSNIACNIAEIWWNLPS